MINTRKLCALLFFGILYNSPIYSLDSSMEQHIDLVLPSTDSKKQKARMRKSKGPKVKKISSYREMNYDELSVAKDKHIASNNIPSAIKYIEQMMKLSDDVAKLSNHLLEIADLVFTEGNFQKAAQRYAEYALLYPGGSHVEYALYRAIISSHECHLSHDRDQTKTEETLALAESFLKKDHFVTYAQEVTKVRDKCLAQLIESEFTICTFYFKRGQIRSTEKRLALIRSTWLPRYSPIEQQLIAFESDVAAYKEELTQKAEKKMKIALSKQEKRMTERF